MKTPELKIHIIAPSSYETSGNETLRQYRSIMMRPPVFDVLGSLIDQAANDLGLNAAVACYNERTERGDAYLSSIIQDKAKALHSVAFVSTKNFELARAIDIALRLRPEGMPVIIGGPAITLADCKTYEYLIQNGISINVGEGEVMIGKGEILKDAIKGELRPVYWQREFVNMRDAPLPRLPEMDEHKQSITRLAAIGTSEGCPFDCNYCSVKKIRGRKVSETRSRDADLCAAWIEEAFARGFDNIMLTDDNLRRSFTYSSLKKQLRFLNRDLRKRYPDRRLGLFVQLDAEPDVVDEIEDLAEMGVRAFFYGFESSDPAVLKLSRKKQNHPDEYPRIVAATHKYNILATSGVMMGFSSQTPESIQVDMRNFEKFLDLPHPFILTPIQGTDLYLEAVEKGQILTWDPNAYDSTRCVADWFDAMTPSQCEAAYRQSFFDLFPESGKQSLRDGDFSLLEYQEGRRFPGRRFAELGMRRIGRPYHMMMDGIPTLMPSNLVVRRPADSFRGFPLEPEDVQYIRLDNQDKANFLTKYL